MSKLPLLLCLFVFSRLIAQGESKIGTTAPDLVFPTVLNAIEPPGSLQDYAGKIVILDFWATWCAPCIEAFPHLEELKATFPEELAVLGITDESEQRIATFIANREVGFPLVLDTEGEFAAAFPHRIVPHTVVLDGQGTVVAVTTSRGVTKAMIADLLAGDSITVPEKRDVLDVNPDLKVAELGNPEFQVSITGYQPGLPSMFQPNGTGELAGRYLKAFNLSPRGLLEIAYGMPSSLFVTVDVDEPERLAWSQTTAICFELIVPYARAAERMTILQEQLALYFPYRAALATEKKSVLVLQRKDDQTSGPNRSEEGEEPYYTFTGNGLTMRAKPLSGLTDFLGNQLQSIVVDETGLTGNYSLELPWFNEKPSLIHSELAKIGLQLVEAEREVEVLVITDR